MLYLDIFCAFFSNICTKAFASLFYIIFVYARFHRNVIFLNSRGNPVYDLPDRESE